MTDHGRANATAAEKPPVKRRGRPSKRGLKREALLEGAAAMFNARGVAGTSLADIAEGLGLARASVYYYVNDRAELVFQCYLRACEVTADDLGAASEAATGFERTLAFVRRAMTPDRPPSAVLSEINYLSSAQAEVVKVAHRRNLAALTGFIEAGIADGSVRPCDCEAAAQSILGMLAWGALSPQWVHHLRGRVFRTRLSAVMADLLTHGVRREGGADPFVCPIDAGVFLPGRFNAFDRREASEMKVEQLLTAASRLFNRDGVEATSLDEITASLGATKGVLYHYLRDKADLVARCYERAFDLLERFEEAARTHGRNGLERMLIGAHLNAQALAGELCPLMPQPGLEALPDPPRAALMARASRLSRVYSRFLRQGVADGSCRPCDTAIVAQMGAGAFGWLSKQRDEGDRRTPIQLGDAVCGLFSEGLKAR